MGKCWNQRWINDHIWHMNDINHYKSKYMNSGALKTDIPNSIEFSKKTTPKTSINWYKGTIPKNEPSLAQKTSVANEQNSSGQLQLQPPLPLQQPCGRKPLAAPVLSLVWALSGAQLDLVNIEIPFYSSFLIITYNVFCLILTNMMILYYMILHHSFNWHSCMTVNRHSRL